MPGPPPKPPGRRQRSNTPSLNLVITPTSPPAADADGIPKPSGEWLTGTVADWMAVWADKAMAVVYNPSTDLPAMYRLFGLRDDRERFRQAVRKQPLVEGSQGQPVANPLAGLIPTLDKNILALEDRFGLSPKARLMLGITLGKAARSLNDLAGGVFDDDQASPRGEEEEDPRSAPVDVRSRPNQS